MGGKVSKPQLQRKKSFSNIGRSSQKSLFQKTKLRLNHIQKKLDEANEDELKTELESIEKELGNVSSVIKEKHKEKYETIVQQVQETREKFDGKFKPQVHQVNEIQVSQPPAEIVEVHSVEPEVEIRKQPVDLGIRPESPKIKFGVQVMPTLPRVSQEMLRNTLPTSPLAKEEFAEIRSQSLNTPPPKTIVHSNYIVEENGGPKSFNRAVSIDETSNITVIEKVRGRIDQLEDALKYFHGTKGDFEYELLHEKFIQSLVKLDNYDVNENPVLKQDKKILIQRIQELLNILERLGAPMDTISFENRKEEYNGDPSIGTPI